VPTDEKASTTVSVQFGRWNLDGQEIGPDYVERVKAVLTAYGLDGHGCYSRDTIKILYNAHHTTKESRLETQPHISPSGVVITWDGRLDNRTELIREAQGDLTSESTDVEIVAAAYEYSATKCFGRLVGDWAMAIWEPNSRRLILAKDHIGSRHLYYAVANGEITWSTILDPLVLFAGRTFTLDREYIAGWFSSFPATHLTPYLGIHAVPPSSFVTLRQGMCTIEQYWEFDPRKTIRYRKDEEYEEHFRTAFANAVARRLRSDSPVLAELSGGMDSSSIVCIADRSTAGNSRVDTISYYDDSEPNWNERPYISKIEEVRRREGCHIDVGSSKQPFFEFHNERFSAIPSFDSPHLVEARGKFKEYLISKGSRVVLSGTGGDEVTGGIPTPTPELANLLARARIASFARQLQTWAIHKRKPLIRLLLETAKEFFPLGLCHLPDFKRPAAWLNSEFAAGNTASLQGYEGRLKFFGPLPSFQENLRTIASLRRQMACSPLPCEPAYEKRYPFLDRDFLEFMFAIPQEQLVRPGQRRSLMRRALHGIVPDELLNRKRKAYVARVPFMALSTERAALVTLSDHMLSDDFGFIDAKLFAAALKDAKSGHDVPLVFLIRTLSIEYWLRSISKRNLLSLTVPQPEASVSSEIPGSLGVTERATAVVSTKLRVLGL
jgi:asparagine synthase (glutamine-hydrolysing)